MRATVLAVLRHAVPARVVVVGLLVGAAGCSSTPLPEVDVVADAAGATAPGPGDVLVDGGWAETAAFVRDAAAAGEGSVVNIFASWCAPCEAELPLLLAASSVTTGVRFLGVASEDRREDAEPFVERLRVTWPTLLDRTALTHIALDGIAMPTTAFFDPDGQLSSVVIGELDAERLADELAAITP